MAAFGTAAGSRVLLAAVMLALSVTVEFVAPRQRYTLRARLRSIGFYMAGALSAGAILWLLQRSWTSIGLEPLVVLHLDRWLAWAGPLSTVATVFVALLLSDFFGYWYHRVQHGPLWPFHAVHHSVEELHAASSYGHIADEAFRFVFMVIPMSFVPIASADIPAVSLLFTFSQFYIHSPTTAHLGPLRYLITDNRYHRIHHSREPRHFNRNYGTTFTIWDQLFGTAYFPEPHEWPATGLAEINEPRSWREWFDLPLRMWRLQADAREGRGRTGE